MEEKLTIGGIDTNFDNDNSRCQTETSQSSGRLSNLFWSGWVSRMRLSDFGLCAKTIFYDQLELEMGAEGDNDRLLE